MATMIERVARAIWDSHEIGDFSTAPVIERGFHINAARSAIAAMMEPTEEMSAAMRIANMNIAGGYGGPGGWEAAVQAALKEERQ